MHICMYLCKCYSCMHICMCVCVCIIKNKIKVKVKLSLSLTKYQAMKALIA